MAISRGIQLIVIFFHAILFYPTLRISLQTTTQDISANYIPYSMEISSQAAIQNLTSIDIPYSTPHLVQEFEHALKTSCNKSSRTCEGNREQRLRNVLSKMDFLCDDQKREIIESALELWKLDPGMSEQGVENKVNGSKGGSSWQTMKELENGENSLHLQTFGFQWLEKDR